MPCENLEGETHWDQDAIVCRQDPYRAQKVGWMAEREGRWIEGDKYLGTRAV